MSNRQESMRHSEVSQSSTQDALSHINRGDLLRGHAELQHTAANQNRQPSDVHAQRMLQGFDLTDNGHKHDGGLRGAAERALDTVQNHRGTESHGQHQFFGAQHQHLQGNWGGYKHEAVSPRSTNDQPANFYQNRDGRPGPSLIQSVGTTVDTAAHHMTTQSHLYGGNNFHSFLKRN